MKNRFNSEVTNFLDGQSHPLRENIEMLREIILGSNSEISENIKWNGPNYCFEEQDRISMRINPPKPTPADIPPGCKKNRSARR